MGRKYTDNALTTLASSITAGSTTLNVSTGTGNNFPVITGHGTPGSTPDYFVITLENASLQREKIRVENRAAASDTLGSGGFPLVRGFDGTTAQAWNTGDSVDLRVEHSGFQDQEDKHEGALRPFGVKGSTTTGLTFGYYGGNVVADGSLQNIADGTVALTASQNNFVERNAAGTVSVNTTAFTAGNIPLYLVTTDSSGITGITDERQDTFPFYGLQSISAAGGGTITLSAAQARAEIIEFTGALPGATTIVFPNVKRIWIVNNKTTGASALTAKVTGQTGVVLVPSGPAVIYGNGTDIVYGTITASAYILTLLSAANAAAARGTLGAETQSAELDAIAALSTTGILARTAAATYVPRTLASSSANLSITNPDGVAGAPSFALDADLDALAALSGTGIAVRTAANTWAQRSIAGTANQVSVANGDGVSANPTISLPSAITLPGSLTMGGLLDTGSTGQIAFPATQNASAGANTLDDYEEGTWTPTLGGTATYSTQAGIYTKIGRMVFISGQLSVTSIGTGQTAIVPGLPFTSSSAVGETPISVAVFTSSTPIVSAAAMVDSSSTNITIRSRGSSSQSDGFNAIFANATSSAFAGCYHV
jgi:hypothetical protein